MDFYVGLECAARTRPGLNFSTGRAGRNLRINAPSLGGHHARDRPCAPRRPLSDFPLANAGGAEADRRSHPTRTTTTTATTVPGIGGAGDRAGAGDGAVPRPGRRRRATGSSATTGPLRKSCRAPTGRKLAHSSNLGHAKAEWAPTKTRQKRLMAIPAQAQPHWHHRHLAPSLQGAYGAAGPVYRPAPFSNGYHEGTDPDPQVPEELMRDPPNDR
jgi:hypothetical protein